MRARAMASAPMIIGRLSCLGARARWAARALRTCAVVLGAWLGGVALQSALCAAWLGGRGVARRAAGAAVDVRAAAGGPAID
jgi:hypothetical protein